MPEFVTGDAEFRDRKISYVNIANIPHVHCRLGEQCGKTFRLLYLMSFLNLWIKVAVR
jgi:hypothetical protein